ncbi:hypothetical protein B0T19DRAFT_411120 [Cercophora scortea]|uniref:Elongator complex protein 6 n=1 Tax=Cercophora scortea TaxID=314031 RepID=A0AAE0MMD3_9PEZI|nr:hypothetical protein B0T19DRAFT_411120 [Cercophora scortea]
MTSRTPPLLEPYLAGLPDEAALVVLTGILGASTNWLVLRYLHSFLKQALGGDEDEDDETTTAEDEPSVLLVSFLRDYTFWKDSASRLGLDLDALARRGRFSFVDGLRSALFVPSSSSSSFTTTSTTTTSTTPCNAIPDRGRPTPTPTPTPPRPAPRPVVQAHQQKWKQPLTHPSLVGVQSGLHSAVDELVRARAARAGTGTGTGGSNGKVILVIDQLDFLLAAAATSSVTSLGLRELLLDLREKVHATILTLSADEPLVVAQTTSLEKEHAAFVLSLAHEAETILSLRLLDTGVAKDVSGVLRITGGGGGGDRRAGRPQVEEKEYLYQVVGDGGVRVFERGGQ